MKKTFLMTLAATAIFAVACEKDEINDLQSQVNINKVQSDAADDVLAGDLNKLEGDLDAFKQLSAEINAAQDVVTQANEVASIARDAANELAIDANAAEIIRVNDELSVAIGNLSDELTAQVSRIDSVIKSNFDELSVAIEAEVAAREAGDDTLADVISKEVKERKDQAEVLLSSISANSEAISKVAEDLASEIENRIKANSELRLELEAAIAKGDDDLRDELQSSINSNSDAIEAAKVRLTEVESSVVSINGTLSSLQSQISSNDSNIISLDSQVKAAAAQAAQAVQDAADAQAAADAAQEAADAAQAVADQNAANIATINTNIVAINASISALSSGTLDLSGIQDSIDSAIDAAILALPADEIYDDTDIKADIAALEAAYKAADVVLQGNINNVPQYNDAALNTEITKLKASISALQTEVGNIPADDDSALSASILALQNALSALETKVDGLNVVPGDDDEPVTFAVTLTQATGGTISSDQSDLSAVSSGTVVTFTATAKDGYSFTSWTGGVATDGTLTITSSVTVSAVFTADEVDNGTDSISWGTFTEWKGTAPISEPKVTQTRTRSVIYTAVDANDGLTILGSDGVTLYGEDGVETQTKEIDNPDYVEYDVTINVTESFSLGHGADKTHELPLLDSHTGSATIVLNDVTYTVAYGTDEVVLTDEVSVFFTVGTGWNLRFTDISQDYTIAVAKVVVDTPALWVENEVSFLVAGASYTTEYTNEDYPNHSFVIDVDPIFGTISYLILDSSNNAVGGLVSDSSKEAAIAAAKVAIAALYN